MARVIRLLTLIVFEVLCVLYLVLAQDEAASEAASETDAEAKNLHDRLEPDANWAVFGRKVLTNDETKSVDLPSNMYEPLLFTSTTEKGGIIQSKVEKDGEEWKGEFKIKKKCEDNEVSDFAWMAVSPGWYKLPDIHKTILVNTTVMEEGLRATIPLTSSWHTNGTIFDQPPVVIAQVQGFTDSYATVYIKETTSTEFSISVKWHSNNAPDIYNVAWIAMDEGAYIFDTGILVAATNERDPEDLYNINSGSSFGMQCGPLSVFANIHTTDTVESFQAPYVATVENLSANIGTNGIDDSNCTPSAYLFKVNTVLFDLSYCLQLRGDSANFAPADAAIVIGEDIEATEKSNTIIYLMVFGVAAVLLAGVGGYFIHRYFKAQTSPTMGVIEESEIEPHVEPHFEADHNSRNLHAISAGFSSFHSIGYA